MLLLEHQNTVRLLGFSVGGGADSDANFGVYFFQFNRSKCEITLGLQKSKGKEMFLKPTKTADVAVENYDPVMIHLEWFRGWESTTRNPKVNPRIVYCSVSDLGNARLLHCIHSGGISAN